MNRLDGNPLLNLALQGRVFHFVDGLTGSDARRRAANRAYATIQAAFDAASSGAALVVTGGTDYDEALVFDDRGKSNIVIVGAGGRGGVSVAPSGTNASALVNSIDDLTLINIGLASKGTGIGLSNNGRRLAAVNCKLEGETDGGGKAAQLSLGTVAQIAAHTHGKGSDVYFENVETAWADTGIQLVATDYGAVTQVLIEGGWSHGHKTAAFEESGGTASIRFRDLFVHRRLFGAAEDGTAPTKYLSLNDDNGNTGVVSECVFPTALNGGLNLVSTGLKWVANRHPAGLSTTQPS